MSAAIELPERPAPTIKRPELVEGRYVQRFTRFDRFLHGFLMLSFLGLAATGLPLIFSHARWAAVMARVFGGFAVAGTLHRLFAVIMITVFVLHIGKIVRRLLIEKDYRILWGHDSLVPQPHDILDMKQHMLWFIGRGTRPQFERYTYWEKFDYWAVFWGMAIIGGSGLMLWFPETFSRVLPGWVFNVALLVHGEEALLAVGFIFTIHFFNGHLRPEKFPMDMVIFTGRVSEAELRHERPGEYDRLMLTGQLENTLSTRPSHRALTVGRLVGTTAVIVGLSLVGMIIFALIRS